MRVNNGDLVFPFIKIIIKLNPRESYCGDCLPLLLFLINTYSQNRRYKLNKKTLSN